MKQFRLLLATAFVFAVSGAFVTHASARFSQTGYNADGNSCISGAIDNTTATCSTSGSTQCTFTYNGMAKDARASCTAGTPPTLGGLLKHN